MAQRESASGIAFAAWTIGQAAVVASYAAGLKPSGGYPLPVEATADCGLAVAQLVLAICFAPALFGDAGRIVRVVAVGLVWTVLAAALAGRSAGETTRLGILVATWTALIGTWRRAPAAAFALLFLTVAGPLLYYLSNEYGLHRVPLGAWPTLLSPPLGACTIRLHGDLMRPLVPCAGGLIVTIATRLAVRRQGNRRSPTS